jgi:hypothetical protein
MAQIFKIGMPNIGSIIDYDGGEVQVGPFIRTGPRMQVYGPFNTIYE